MADVFGDKRGKCSLCGERNTIQVRVMMLELGPKGVPTGRSKSSGKSLCEEHALSVYDELVDARDTLVERGGLAA